MAKILIVDDDPKLIEMVNDLLTFEHYETEVVANGQDALHLMQSFPFDLVILDWQLPDLEGIEICKRFRSGGHNTPVLILTGKRSVDEKEAGLDAGADDYLTKPFHRKELSARVRALLRRPPQLVEDILRFEDLVLDPRKYHVTKGGQPLHLTPREFTMLEFFMRHPGQVFSLEALVDRIWHSEDAVTFDSLRVCIKRLRAKIDTPGSPSLLTTIYGTGYVFDKPETPK